MKFRRWPHGLATLVLLCAAVVLLVTFETGSTGRPPRPPATASALGALPAGGPEFEFGMDAAGHAHGKTPKPSRTAPPEASDPAAEDPTTSQAATGSQGSVAAGPRGDPRAHGLTMNPFNFRLGLINGTVVKPDARDWAARTVSTGPLLLFLPATGHVPDDYRRFLTVAAQSGYHVLGLDFWNRGHAVANICGMNAACYTEVQRNRFTGEGPSQFSKVDEANSVLSRLHAALDYLVVHDPDGGWGQYTHSEHLDWADIVVAGHSQGGGEAAYIAHRYRVMGQLTFSSPIITDQDVSASWLKTRSATPADRMYAFDDIHDVFYPRIVTSWRELHLSGRLTANVPVPTTAATHELVSTLDIGDPGQAHIRSVGDSTPLSSSGAPVFEPVWKWMLAQVYRAPAASSN
jgi:hypothetical protein